MKNYEIDKDIYRIRTYFGLTQELFANEIGVSRLSITRYENSATFPENDVLEKIYSYSYQKGLNLNAAKASFYLEDKKDSVLLFHGAKGLIIGEVDNEHSELPNDFGMGFYAGETLQQAATWIVEQKNGSVYCFYFNDKDLKHMVFDVDETWMYAILYYRGAFKGFDVPKEIMDLINQIEETDYLIAPIADNQMYMILNQFANGEITDQACIHALSMTNLGKQYVFKSMKACSKLQCICRLYLCEKERDHYVKDKIQLSTESNSKADLAKIEFRLKGKFFDDIFKRI